MKKLFKILAAILLVIVLSVTIVILALVLFINPNDYKPQLQQLAARHNVQLNIAGDLSWSFYPHFGIHVGSFSVKPPMKNVTKPFQFDSLDLSIALWPLLHREIHVKRVAIRASEISLQDNPGKNAETMNVTTIRNLLIESQDANLVQRSFPFAVSLQASTSQPPRDITLQATTQLSIDQDITHILADNLSMQMDDTKFKGNIDATLGNIPFLKMNLVGTTLNMDHYFPSVTDEQHKGNTLTSHHNTAGDNDELIPASSIRALPGEYYFLFDDLTLKHLHGKHFSFRVLISPEGILTIKELMTKAYGGEFLVQGAIDTRPAQPDVTLKMTLKRLNLEPALKDYFLLDKTFASGDVDFAATITTRGLTQNQLMKAMNGKFSFSSPKITLNNFDITSSLNASLLQFLQLKLPALTANENQTVLSDIEGEGVLQQGVINNTALVAAGPCIHFKGAGTYNLLDADVLYHMGITFPSADKNETCSEINPRLKDIVWPVECKGSLDAGAAKICSADTASMKSMVKQETGQKLEKKIDEQLQKKFGKDANVIKNALKGLR